MTRIQSRKKRQKRVKAKIFGTKEVPRLSVYRSLQYLYVQLIDDENQRTLIGMTDRNIKGEKLTKTKKAEVLGKELAKKALEMKLKRVIFDRGGNSYFGRVKALAEAARKEGLTI